MTKTVDTELPLRVDTPDAWAAMVLEQPLRLLNDHAHLEKKAAQNALELLHRWPEPNPPENWVTAMTAIAKDEVEHLALVTRLLARRGGELTKSHRNLYAGDLRGVVRQGQGIHETIDRLMTSALLEARSCERFELLARHCPDEELARIYQGLWASEKGHYLLFIDLARQIEAEGIEERWGEMLDAEAEIIQRQPGGPRMHSWVR